MARSHYDIAIVGAGPAGANLARLLDHDKYKIVIIDGSDGHDKVCGGLISPDAQSILARYDICLPKDVLVSPQLFSVRTIDLCNGAVRHYRRSYLNADRKKLDDFFRSLIPDSVNKLQGRCKSVSECAEGYEIELVSGEKLTCTYIVGADGASGNVRLSLFRKKRLQKYVAIQQWFPAGEDNPYYSCIFDNETSSGCSWIFFKDGMMIFGGAFDLQNCREAFEEQKKKLIDGGFVSREIFDNVKKTEACLVSRPHLGYGIFKGKKKAFLIGEAAGFISPSSFEGISYALSSSEMLADAFNRHSIGQHRQIQRFYGRKTRGLKSKVRMRCIKRPFMYNKNLRALVMKSGLTAIKIKLPKEKQ
ncbi:MAG: FAD-binding protein [Clostridia bacterium]|nr:FAD-binding protein [Clostridia bacterium]